MKKPFRRGQCPACYRPCRRWLQRWPGGNVEIVQPYCAKCAGKRFRFGPGIYLKWPEELRIPTWDIGGYLGYPGPRRTTVLHK